MKVNYPGFEAIPHVRPAMRRLKKNFKLILSANMVKFSKLFTVVSNQAKPKVEKLKTEKINKVSKSRTDTRKQPNLGSAT